MSRELDAEVAVKVMGWCVLGGRWWHPSWPDAANTLETCPAYSANTAAAMEVTDWLRNRYTNVSMFATNGWRVSAWNVDENGGMGEIVAGKAMELPEAICLAAISACKATASAPKK